MENRFCTNCGAPLEPGAMFCVECGQPVEDDTQQVDSTVVRPAAPATCPNCGAPLEEGALFCTSCGYRLDGTAPAGQVGQAEQAGWAEQPLPAYGAAQGAAQPNGGKKRGLGTGAIVAIVVAAVVVAAVAVVVALGVTGHNLPWQQDEGSEVEAADDSGSSEVEDDSSSSDDSDSDDSSSSDDSDSDDSSSSDSEQESITDEEFHEQLVAYYNKLSAYDARIKSCATEFNNGYTKTDKSTRQNAAQTSYDLEAEIQADVSAFAQLDVPSDTAYSSQYAAIARCLDDNLARISCIAASWRIDLNYDAPADHTDEILAPIAAQNVDGKNQSLADYESVYPTIQL